MMEISVVNEHNITYFVIKGDIDEKGAEIISNHFKNLMGKTPITQMILDFRSVKYIGSSGIGAIILFYKKLAPSGGKVHIRNVSQEIFDLLSDLDINKIIQISKS